MRREPGKEVGETFAEADPGLRDHRHLQDGILRHDDQLELQATQGDSLDLQHGAKGRPSALSCPCCCSLAPTAEDRGVEAVDNDGHCARRGRGDGDHTRVGEAANQGEQKAQLGDGRLLSPPLVPSTSRGDLLQSDTMELSSMVSKLPWRLSRRECQEFFVKP